MAIILESLAYSSRAAVRLSIESALEAPQLWLSDLNLLLQAAWFEDLGLLPRRHRRHQLAQYVELSAALLQHMTLAARMGGQRLDAAAFVY